MWDLRNKNREKETNKKTDLITENKLVFTRGEVGGGMGGRGDRDYGVHLS